MLRLLDDDVSLQEDAWNFTEALRVADLEEKVIVLRPLSNGSWKKLIKIVPLREYHANYFLIEEIREMEDHIVTFSNELKLCRLKVCQACITDKKPLWFNNRYFEVDPNSRIAIGWDYPSER